MLQLQVMVDGSQARKAIFFASVAGANRSASEIHTCVARPPPRASCALSIVNYVGSGASVKMYLFGVLMAAAAFAALPSSAVLADKPAQKPLRDYGWSGPYVGGFLGLAHGSSEIATDAGVATSATYFLAPSIASVNKTGTGSVDDDSFVGGVVAGRNFQSGKIVYGIEVDFGSFRLTNAVGGASVPYPTFPAAYSMRAEIETDWLLTARARVGWTPVSNFLIYATGGLAVTRVQVSNSFSDNTTEEAVGGTSDKEVKLGWTIGGGAEWALSRHWSFKAEYLHVDFGSAKASSSVFCGPSSVAFCSGLGFVPSPFVSSADLSADIVRLGLNYRF